MSYCRWSSDNWMCDVYAYESVEGYVTHVACNKRTGFITPLDYSTSERLTKTYTQQMKDLKNTQFELLNLPYDGETLTDDTLEDFKDTMTGLKNVGYNIPDFVFEIIDEELSQE